jgi:hypothetical protein
MTNDIRRLPDEAFASTTEPVCKACERYESHCTCDTFRNRIIDQDALRDCIRERLDYRLSPVIAKVLSVDIMENILESFTVRLKP